MIKNQKRKALVSSVIILLPIVFGLLFWNQLPATMTSHWGADGIADGTASKAFVVLGMPLILLGLHWLLLWWSLVIDKKNAQNGKIITICYSIIPALSLVMHIFIYSVALEKDWNIIALIPVLIGAMFLFIGNYLPKTTRNRTMGIKLHWTMGNDENWQKTHRLGGKIYFWGGIAVIISALLPVKMMIAVMIVMIVVSVILPSVYSYSIYRKHKAEGVVYEPVFNTKTDKAALRTTAVMVPLILIGVTVLMVTGEIEMTYGENEFQIIASYSDDITVQYEDVDSLEYRETFDIGVREMGFGSPRLSMGTFKNAEFGRYTIYAYTKGEGAVVLKKGDDTLVIVGKTAAETKEIYNFLLEKVQ